MSNVTIGIDIDDTQANEKLVTLQTKIDAQVQQWSEERKLITTELMTTNIEIDNTVRDWKIRRQEIYMQLSEFNRAVGLTIQTVRLAAQVTGQTIKPYQNAALNMISSTTSMMLATSAAMSLTGFLAAAAVALAAFAFGFNMVQSAHIIATSEELQNDFANIVAQFKALEKEVGSIHISY